MMSLHKNQLFDSRLIVRVSLRILLAIGIIGTTGCNSMNSHKRLDSFFDDPYTSSCLPSIDELKHGERLEINIQAFNAGLETNHCRFVFNRLPNLEEWHFQYDFWEVPLSSMNGHLETVDCCERHHKREGTVTNDIIVKIFQSFTFPREINGTANNAEVILTFRSGIEKDTRTWWSGCTMEEVCAQIVSLLPKGY